MKKNDLIIVGILVALMFAWMRYYPAIEKKYFPKPAQPAVENVETTPPSPSVVEETAVVSVEPEKGTL